MLLLIVLSLAITMLFTVIDTLRKRGNIVGAVVASFIACLFINWVTISFLSFLLHHCGYLTQVSPSLAIFMRIIYPVSNLGKLTTLYHFLPQVPPIVKSPSSLLQRDAPSITSLSYSFFALILIISPFFYRDSIRRE